MKFAIVILVAPVLFIVLDLIWFAFAGGFFKSEISNIARLDSSGNWDVRYLPALFVYIFMAIGLYIFVLPQINSVMSALVWGGFFGLISYAIYDLTNLATLTDWTVKFAIVDMAWGAFLVAVVTTIIYLILEAVS